LAETSFRPQSIFGRDGITARQLFRTPLFDECPRLYDAEFFHTHRADVHSLLLSLLPPENATLNADCVGVQQTESKAIALFTDGSEFEADIIVGADGIHSPVRKQLFGNDAPRFTGNMCWRTVFPVDGVQDFISPDASFWLGPKGHVVTYYLRAGKMVNVVAIRETKDWVEESWSVPSTREEVQKAFAGWHPNVQRLFEQPDQQIFKWGLFDRDPMKTWASGRVTLLGDAAHPMLPFLSQGAAMAIEDGYVLARALSTIVDPKQALLAYENHRLPRTSRVQLESRKRGETYHQSSWQKMYRDLRYKIKQLIEPQKSGIQADWVYSYDATNAAL
jgi:salicylate hydroxylase